MSQEAVFRPSINLWTFNLIFKEIGNFTAPSKRKRKREECLTKPSIWTLGLKKALPENAKAGTSQGAEQHTRNDPPEATTKTPQKAEHILVTLEINLIKSLCPLHLQNPFPPCLMLGFSSKWLCSQCQSAFGWTVSTRKSCCCCWSTEHISGCQCKNSD